MGYMNPFEQFLLSDSPQSGVSPEVLEMLGRKAATQFLNEGMPLNDSIAALVEQHPELQNEHIKRVVEFANNVAFQEMFSKSEDKNVHFDIADPGTIIRDMKDGGSPAHDGKALNTGSKDYLSPPTMEKDEFGDADSGMQHLQRMSGMEGRFGQGEQVQEKQASLKKSKKKESCLGKTATDWRTQELEGELASQFLGAAEPESFETPNHHEHSNPVENVYDLRVKLAAARAELVTAHETYDLLIKEAREELYQALKHEVMDPYGAGINGSLHALNKIASQRDLMEVLPEMFDRMVTESVPAQKLQITKTAAKADVINYGHPIVQAWSGLVKAAEDGTKSLLALNEIDDGLAQVNEFIRQAG